MAEKNGNGLKIPKALALEKRLDFYDKLWKEGIMTKKISRADYKEILDKLGPSACRSCGKESEKKNILATGNAAKDALRYWPKKGKQKRKRQLRKTKESKMANYTKGSERFIPRNLKLKVEPCSSSNW